MSQSSFIHGFHAVIAKLRHQPDAILEIFIDSGRNDGRARDLLKHAELHGVRPVEVEQQAAVLRVVQAQAAGVG